MANATAGEARGGGGSGAGSGADAGRDTTAVVSHAETTGPRRYRRARETTRRRPARCSDAVQRARFVLMTYSSTQSVQL